MRDSSGTLPDFLYAGLLWVPEMGLYASSTRFYDPGTTRWLNSDWIREAGGINMYGYVGGNPIMWIDPMGLKPSEKDGDRFKTIEEAACDALNFINPTSIYENWEYGGTIRKDRSPKDPSKPYYATTPNKGTDRSYTLHATKGIDLAGYHTHGDYSKFDPNDPEPDPQKKKILRTDKAHAELADNFFSSPDMA